MTEIQPPQIIVFESEKSGDIIRAFETQGYACLLDSVNGENIAWFKRELVNPHRIYRLYESSASIGFEVDTADNLEYKEDFEPPDFVIAYNADADLSFSDWVGIKCYLGLLISFDPCISEHSEVTETIFRRPITEKIEWGNTQEGGKFDPTSVSKDFGDIVTTGNVTTSEPPAEILVKEEYKYETLYLEKRDTMIYQVNRPGTKKPFTVVTTKFDVKGHKPFFTSLFASNDWAMNRLDVCRYDVPFLEQVWKHLEMDGPFEMDRMLKDATEACYPSSTGTPIEVEPVVYRNDITHVVKILAKRDHGLVESVEEAETLDNLKKRRKLQ